MTWKRVLWSPWTTYAVLMGGAALFQWHTAPWSSPIIPTPYTMFYGVGVVFCAQRGFLWGLLASWSWYWMVFPWYWRVEMHLTGIQDYRDGMNQAQLIRLALQTVAPLLVSVPMHLKRRADRQRDYANRQRAELLSILSVAVPHEFNNLLMVIMGSASLIRDSLPADLRVWADEIISNSERAARLVRALREHAKMGAVSPELLDTASLIAAIDSDREPEPYPAAAAV